LGLNAHASYTVTQTKTALRTHHNKTEVQFNSNYPDAGCPDHQLSGRWLFGSPIIRTLVVRITNYPDAGCPDRQLSGRWLSGSPIIRIGLALRVNLSKTVINETDFKFPVI
jgi:hypothetical protein